MRKWVISIITIALLIFVVGAVSPAAFAIHVDPVSLTAPYDSIVTLTYLGNPYNTGTEVMDFEPPASLTIGAPYNLGLGEVGSMSPTGGNLADMGAKYNVGTIKQGQELRVNLSGIGSYSTNSTLSNYYPRMSSTQVSADVTDYSISWYGFIYYGTQPTGYYASHGQIYDYPLNVTFTRTPGGDSLSNTTAVREFYTNVYPHLWSGATFKIPVVVIMGSDNSVAKVQIKSSWDPATIGMTKAQVDQYVLDIYGVLPTYV